MTKSDIQAGDIPYLTTDQMVEVDRTMVFDLKIELIQMMENAGRTLAHLARSRFLAADPRGRRVVVMAGTGGNGGGALVCARRLSNYGADVVILITKPAEKFKPVPRHQLDILTRMGAVVQVGGAPEFSDSTDLIVDGIIGYSLQGAPRGSAEEMIRWANSQPAPILSLDAPSGLDASSGTVYEPAIQATATCTLALPKVGFLEPEARQNVGELYLADISVPPSLYAGPTLRLEVGPIFAQSDIIRLW